MKEKTYPLLYRIWHWTMALSVLGLLTTVALRKTFLSYKTNALLIQEKLSAISVEITLDQAQAIAKAIRAPMWEWHYIFAAVLGLSMAFYLVGLATRRFTPPLAGFSSFSRYEKFKKSIHALLLLSVWMMAVSGALLYFRDALALEPSTMKSIKNFHETAMNALILFLLMHLGGVFRHELSTREPVISRMIHGDDTPKN